MNKHFNLYLCSSDLDKFEKERNNFIYELIAEYKNDIPHISEADIYSLLLISAIIFNKIDIVETILVNSIELAENQIPEGFIELVGNECPEESINKYWDYRPSSEISE